MRPFLLSDSAFHVIQSVLHVISIFFIIYLLIYSTFLFCSVVTSSATLYQKRREERLKNTLLRDYYIPVSILVPAHNESVTVVDTVRSLLSLQYTVYEIVVVDDGSDDDTADQLISAFSLLPIRRPIRRQIPCEPEEAVYESAESRVPITLIRKKNGGKADALNMGINACRYPYFICLDADSVLQYDSLSKIVHPILEESDVVAVGGVVRPANGIQLKDGHVVDYRLPRSLLAAMQVLEYDRSFLSSRVLFDEFNGSLIISGAFGLFKKETVIAAGGYDVQSVGEDMELVMKLHEFCVVNELPYRVKYATDAVCWSQVPERLGDLCRQRRRWHIGLFQSLWGHRMMLFNLKFGAVSFVSYLYFLIYELLSPVIEVFGLLCTAVAFLVDLINVPFMLTFFLIYAVFGSVLTLTAFFARVQTTDLTVTFRDGLKALLLCFLEVVGLRGVLVGVRLTAFFGYRKSKHQWGSIRRQKITYE